MTVTFSKSGRFLFAGYEDYQCRAWDIFAGKGQGPLCAFGGHENRISSIAVNPAGDAILSGSWDTFLRVRKDKDNTAIKCT